MRIFVTGATGFVGGWLQRELVAAGHEVVPAPGPDRLDITDREGLASWFKRTNGGPGAIVHLAGMASAPDAARDPAEAFRVNVAGTAVLFEALRELGIRPAVLVSGSSEVYGAPRAKDLPLSESAPVAPRQPYAVSKLGQEAVAVEAAVRHGFPVVVTRSFNHTGPGQRPVFVVPAMARRVLAVVRGEAEWIPAGNVDVRRDLSDVRDVVRAYRLLVETAASGALSGEPLIVNVGSGTETSIRSVVERLCESTGISPRIHVDPALVRADDPSVIRADISLLRQVTGWGPMISLDQTLADVLWDAKRNYRGGGE